MLRSRRPARIAYQAGTTGQACAGGAGGAGGRDRRLPTRVEALAAAAGMVLLGTFCTGSALAQAPQLVGNLLTRRGGDTATELDVTVRLTPPVGNDWSIPTANLSQDVTFAAGEDTAVLSVGALASGSGALGISSTASMGGTLLAEVEAVTGYTITNTAEVEVLVLDGPLWVASLGESSLVFTEEGGSQDVVIELRALHRNMGAPVANADSGADALVGMRLLSGNGTATSGTDFSPVSENLDAHDRFGYRRADGHLVGRRNAPVSITSDSEDEGPETLTLTLGINPFTVPSGVMQTRAPNGTLSENDAVYTATIRDTPDAHIEDQIAVVGTNFSFTVPSSAFAHLGLSLTYSARQLHVNAPVHRALPSWLTFTASTDTFTGMPTSSDVGRAKVEVTARASGGVSDSEVFEIVVSAKPSISGVGRVGETLTAVTGATDTFTYQWVRFDGTTDTDISVETDATYTLGAADSGKKVKVKATYGSGMNATTLTSDAYPPYANVQPASVGTPDVHEHRGGWSGMLTVGARVVGPFSEVIGHGWAKEVGRLTQIDTPIVLLDGNTYKIGAFVMLYEQEGDLVDLMVMTPGSLVFSLIGVDEDRGSTGTTRQLTAEEKAGLRLGIGEKLLGFADANELDWGHYEWQTPDMVWAVGDSIPLSLSVVKDIDILRQPRVDGRPAIGGVGSNSVWDAGDTATVTLTFDEAVDVDTTNGTPTVGLDLSALDASPRLPWTKRVARVTGGIPPGSISINSG